MPGFPARLPAPVRPRARKRAATPRLGGCALDPLGLPHSATAPVALTLGPAPHSGLIAPGVSHLRFLRRRFSAVHISPRRGARPTPDQRSAVRTFPQARISTAWSRGTVSPGCHNRATAGSRLVPEVGLFHVGKLSAPPVVSCTVPVKETEGYFGIIGAETLVTIPSVKILLRPKSRVRI